MAPGDMSNEPQYEVLPNAVQAHLGRASRFVDGSTRNWTIFYFFRILPKAEVEKTMARLQAVNSAKDPRAKEKAARELMAAIEYPKVANAGLVAQGEEDNEASPGEPAKLFLDWLKVLTASDSETIGKTITANFVLGGYKQDDIKRSATSGAPRPDSGGTARTAATGSSASATKDAKDWMLDLFSKDQSKPEHTRTGFVENLASRLDDPTKMAEELAEILRNVSATLSDPKKFGEFFQEFGSSAGEAGLNALAGGLLNVTLYELLREMAPALLKGDDAPPSIMRSEAAENKVLPKRRNRTPREQVKELRKWDPAPINYAFTYSGLEALGIVKETLASFPDPFKQGMAARAERLGDTGPSAPEYWDNVLGLKCVHGYFTGGFLVGGDNVPVKASLWQQLRDEVRQFNDRSGDHGRMLRRRLGLLFKMIGLEILHIELGEDPHDVGEDGTVKRRPYRMEHFGFRDGISQPFVDMKLADTAPGGGTPGPNRTWVPVAPGEIYLDKPDEGNNIHELPVHEKLRRGSTFLVFRKLEQDVAGFRIFLCSQRPDDEDEQTKLAAQFVGRWPNGTPLIKAPHAELHLGDDRDGFINDFRYAADDPLGRSCPLGAHVRRSNPRDIGGTDDVRRHRILRRGIAYGGPLLPKGVLGDGNKRGLLFIAANARIDLQFELIQSNWINRGEFLGQAGLGRCPLTGTNNGSPEDAFLEANAGAPVTNVPRFVTTRGGDYFFAPGLEALIAIANGEKFGVERRHLPLNGDSLGDTMTPMLFSEQRLKGYVESILRQNPKSYVRLRVPSGGLPGDPANSPVTFIGQLADVKQVLSIRTRDDKIIHSVAQYRDATRRISRGYDMLVGTEPGVDPAMTKKRKRMRKILETAWKALGPNVYGRLGEIIQRHVELALRRTGPSRRIDLVHDLCSFSLYGVLKEMFGTPGPEWLSELAVALRFSHQHIGNIEPDWLLAAGARKPDDAGLVTLQIWSILLTVDIVANYAQQRELMALSNQAGSELMAHLDMLVAMAREKLAPRLIAAGHGAAPGGGAGGEPPPSTLVDAFVLLEPTFTRAYNYRSHEYYADVRMLLLELVASALGAVPGTFGVVMGTLLDHNAPLTDLMPTLLAEPRFLDPEPLPLTSSLSAALAPAVTAINPKKEDGLKRLIYETWRLNPSIKLLIRHCMQDDELPSKAKLKANDCIVSIIAAAGLDPRAFAQPKRFSLWPFLPGPARNLENYLMFGAVGGLRECWGRDALALEVLKECLRAAARLEGLGRVAGARGEPMKIAETVIGLSARFSRVLPDWPRPKRERLHKPARRDERIVAVETTQIARARRPGQIADRARAFPRGQG